MKTNYPGEDFKFVKKYHWLGIAVVCILSTPLHFIYEWSGENFFVGLFNPINESIWEHLKLVFWPLLLWWGLGYLIFRKSKHLSLIKWLTAACVSILLSMSFIVSWYYTWVNGLDTESSIIDIGSLFIAVPLGQLVAIHLYKVLEPRKVYLLLSTLLLILFAGMFIVFTSNPPNLSIFIPPN